jgi:Zn-dependent protease with chaperone function
MDADAFVPLLLPAVAWPLAGLVSAVLRPRLAAWLLTISALVLAAGSTASLCVLAFAGLSLVPVVARIGNWSPQTLRGIEPVSVPVEAAAGVVLAAVLVSVLIAVFRQLRWLAHLRRTIDGVAAPGGLVVLPDAEPMAVAVPLRGGRVVVSRSMLAALAPAERCALLTHERVHLRCRHHLFLAAVALSTALNPLLWPLRSAVVFLLERWADEVTSARMGDRRVVAAAVAKAALATRVRIPLTLAADGGPVPRRVSALLNNRTTRFDWRFFAGLCMAMTIVVTAWSAEAVVEAAADLHTGIETASLGHHHRCHSAGDRVIA